MLDRVMGLVDDVLCGSLYALGSVNREVQERIEQCQIEDFEGDERLKCPMGWIEGMQGAAVRRVERLEGKAMVTLLAAAVVLVGVVILGANGLLWRGQHGVYAFAGILLIVAVVYLASSAILALAASEASDTFRPELFSYGPRGSEEYEKRVLLYCIEQNWRVGTIRSNRLYSSSALLANGISSVFLLVLLLTVASVV